MKSLLTKKVVFNEKHFTVSGNNIGWWDRVCNNTWEPYTYKILNTFLNESSVVIDIGAWIGLITIYAAQIACKVHAIEPDKIAYDELRESVNNTEQCSKIDLYNCAISNFDGQIELGNDLNLGNSMTRMNQSGNLFKIDCYKLSTFCEKNNISKVDFLKIDIEGSEELLFQDLEFIKKYIPTIFVQLHKGFFINESKFIENLNKLSELYDFVYDENLNLIDKSNVYNYNNLVFTNKII